MKISESIGRGGSFLVSSLILGMCLSSSVTLALGVTVEMEQQNVESPSLGPPATLFRAYALTTSSGANAKSATLKPRRLNQPPLYSAVLPTEGITSLTGVGISLSLSDKSSLPPRSYYLFRLRGRAPPHTP